MKNKTCFTAADILLPKENPERFAVIACDQFTSEPEYWDRVKNFTDGYPTAYQLILPEIYLSDDNTAYIDHINLNMKEYLKNGVFREIQDSFVYVERVQSDGVIRQGLVGKVDLKDFTYTAGGNGKIRSTEKTVLERIPPRAAIRENAPLELPHAMLLFDDGENKVMSYLQGVKSEEAKLYDFTLFGGSGSISGYRVNDESAERVESLLSYIENENNGLLFCVGDGNHSLAAAKSIYEKTGREIDRYALVEIVNINSPAIDFEPIYRVVFGVNPKSVIDEFTLYCSEKGGKYKHSFRCVFKGGEREIEVSSDFSLPVAALQDFLDTKKAETKTDYIHGIDSTCKIACASDSAVGFIFEGMKKKELFSAVIKDGSLPRKTFSLGHALDKRFYLEGRKIK